jgi:hypothetical protein
MRVELIFNKRWRENQEARAALGYQAGVIIRQILQLPDHERISIVQHPLVIRPLQNKPHVLKTFGLLTHSEKNGYHIALNIDLCLASPDIAAMIATHETAHLICAVLYRYWGHGPMWRKRNDGMRAKL